MTPEEAASLSSMPIVKIIFAIYGDDEILRGLAMVFLKIPWEYGAFGVTGKRYDAARDFLEWHGYDPAEFLPVIMRAGAMWAAKATEKK